MKFGVFDHFFLISAQLICRSLDISKYFRGALGLRNNESRLYFMKCMLYVVKKETPHFNYFEREREREREREKISELCKNLNLHNNVVTELSINFFLCIPVHCSLH